MTGCGCVDNVVLAEPSGSVLLALSLGEDGTRGLNTIKVYIFSSWLCQFCFIVMGMCLNHSR